MLSLMIAAATLGATPLDAWDIHAPYKADSALVYEVNITIDEGTQQTNVDMLMNQKTTKKTDSGYEGSFGWTELYVDDSPQPDQSFNIALKPNGVLKSVDSDYGEGMRRMFLPFLFVYPDKKVDVGDSWTYKDTSEDEKDGHTVAIEYKVLAVDPVKDKKALKIQSKLTEEGPDPMKADGTFWIGEDGTVLKYESNVTAWPVPVAQQVFNAKIEATLHQ